MIRFQIRDFGFVTLKVFDVLGREVAPLVNKEELPGTFRIEFNGSPYPSGLYLYRLTTPQFTDTRKMLLLK